MTTFDSEFTTRLIMLPDGRPGLRGSIHVDVRAHRSPKHRPTPKHRNTDAPVLDFISSDATLDRYQEIITPSGWQLENYRRNPVFQNAHQYGDIIFTLGKALITEVRDAALFQRIEFATSANPVARIAHALYAGGFLHTVSVGFFPIRWENGTQETPFRRKYLEQELLEVSAVAIPANPNALALALKSGALEKSDLRDTLDLLRSLCPAPDSPTSPTGPTRPTGPTNSQIHPLLSLARELRSILRHS